MISICAISCFFAVEGGPKNIVLKLYCNAASFCYLQFAQKMEQAQSMFTNVSLAHDVDSARQLLQQHQDLKKRTSSCLMCLY